MARTLFRLMLVRAGFDVLEALDGYDALAQLETQQPDAMILDVMMPGLDGVTVCRRLRGEVRTAALPIIMLSARTDAESVQAAMQAGATLYLKKPVSADELTRHVRHVLAATAAPTAQPSS